MRSMKLMLWHWRDIFREIFSVKQSVLKALRKIILRVLNITVVIPGCDCVLLMVCLAMRPSNVSD